MYDNYCCKCKHYKRKRWVQYYEPKNYHPIGMTHCYGYCTKQKEKCRKIRKCWFFDMKEESQ